jgi:hypothetical protein
MKPQPTMNNIMKELNFKYIALGILIGYLSPYVIAPMKSYFSPRREISSQESIYAN